MYVCGYIKEVVFDSHAYGTVKFHDHIGRREHRVTGVWPDELKKLKFYKGGLFLEIAESHSEYGNDMTLVQAVGESMQMASGLMGVLSGGSRVSKAVDAIVRAAAFDPRRAVMCPPEQFVQRLASMPPQRLADIVVQANIISAQTAHAVTDVIQNIFSKDYAQFANAYPLLSGEERYHLWSVARKCADGFERYVIMAPYGAARAALKHQRVKFVDLDRLAMTKLHLHPQSQERVRRYAVECIRRHIHENQHSMVAAQQIIDETAQQLRADVPHSYVRQTLLDAWKVRAQPWYPSDEDARQARFDLGEDWAVLLEGEWAYPLPHWQAEQLIAHQARAVVPQPPVPAMTTNDLHPLQRQALEHLFAHHMSILTGSPGTGKTLVAAVGILWLIRANFQVVIGCPTGKAAQRMATALREVAAQRFGMTSEEVEAGIFLKAPTTVHKLVLTKQQPEALSGQRDTAKQALRPLVVIVDEASMAGLQAFGALLERFQTATKWLLVGDPFQLPSISPGRVLLDMIQSQVLPTTELQHIYRTQEQGRTICCNAAKVRDFMKGDQIQDTQGQDVFVPMSRALQLEPDASFVLHTDEDQSVMARVAMAIDFYREHDNRFPACQVLCQKVRTCEAINHGVREEVNAQDGMKTELRVRRNGVTWRVGDRVMCIKNLYADHDPTLMIVSNGEMGTLVAIDEPQAEHEKPGAVLGGVTSSFCRVMTVRLDGGTGGEFHRIWVSSQVFNDNFTWAYAITTHKSQGCEWDHVMLHIDAPNTSPLHTAHLVYTGFTRARRTVIIEGVLRKLDRALATTGSVYERGSRLAQRIKQQ